MTEQYSQESYMDFYKNSGIYDYQKEFVKSFPTKKLIDLKYQESNQILKKFYSIKENVTAITKKNPNPPCEVLNLELAINEKINDSRETLENQIVSLYSYIIGEVPLSQQYNQREKQFNELTNSMLKAVKISHIYSNFDIKSPTFDLVQSLTIDKFRKTIESKFHLKYGGPLFRNENICLSFIN